MNFGIKAVEIYFPNQCVDQAELEKFDGVSQGKYTIGLGQTKMSFCDDREDIYSLALTAVSSLLSKYSIDPKSIGRLEVGTETILDKSKSVKSVLMQLFAPHGNTNIEGIDTVNACYGGTNAFFNTMNWLESSAWDGRDAIVVAGDIALYKKGNARPTGGAGCVAMLCGPDAPIVVDAGLRGSYITHAYDFYKPDLTSEYPVVDGQFSLRCYAEALTACYKAYNERAVVLAAKAAKAHTNGSVNGSHANGDESEAGAPGEVPLDRFDYMAFHAPTCKTVAKSYARLMYNDYLANTSNKLFEAIPDTIQKLSPAESLTDKVLEKTFLSLSSKRFNARVQASTQVPTNCGNMYCASLYSGLVSILSFVAPSDLAGKRIGMFSYGSGLASSLFSLKVIPGDAGVAAITEIARKLDVKNRLETRNVVPPQTYDDMCNLRERAHLKSGYKPSGSTEGLAKGTWYLTNVDEMFRRSYEVKQ